MASVYNNPWVLSGTHRNRVFVGGSYAASQRSLLDRLRVVVDAERFIPIIADEYPLPQPDRDIHDVTLFLLHACKLAVFECSTLSGALMEIERLADYGIQRALLLYQSQSTIAWPLNPTSWRTSQMLKSLVTEQESRLVVRPYFRVRDAEAETRRFLKAVRRSSYGKLHSL